MNTNAESTAHDSVKESRPSSSSQEPAAHEQGELGRGEAAVCAETGVFAGLDVDEFRKMPPELLELLAAAGC